MRMSCISLLGKGTQREQGCKTESESPEQAIGGSGAGSSCKFTRPSSAIFGSRYGGIMSLPFSNPHLLHPPFPTTQMSVWPTGDLLL